MEIILVIIGVICIILLAAVLALLLVNLNRSRNNGPDSKQGQDFRQEIQQNIQSSVSAGLRELNGDIKEELSYSSRSISESVQQSISGMGGLLQSGQKQFSESSERQMKQFQEANTIQIRQLQEHTAAQVKQFQDATMEQMKELKDSNLVQMKFIREENGQQMEAMNLKLEKLTEGNEKKLEEMRRTLNESLEAVRTETNMRLNEIRTENAEKLNEIRGTVDEKLQTTLEKRIAESFKAVSDQLEQVYKGLGEMQTLANDVGGLKKVLSGVKTRGILGEVQLAAILEEILAPGQYDTNVATVPGSSERVEFAVKLPGSDEDGIVYLPVDAKFPGERYAQLRDAQDSGDRARIDEAYKNLETVIRLEAKDIRDKYIAPPHTTNFAIMFLPFEGLYLEVVNRGLVEELQNRYQVNIAGPSTMAALLNSLQMGFKTLAIQKRSNEVWKVLSEVKTEFGKFEDVLKKMQSHLGQTAKDLDLLIGTRTNVINRKLRDVQILEVDPDMDMLQIADYSKGEEQE